MRRLLALALCAVLATPAAADDRPSLWDKLRGRGRPKAEKPAPTGPLATLGRKLAEAKSQRQQLARLGADPADLHRMDARIAGIEELGELLLKREEMQRNGTPRTEFAELDRRIRDVRDGLRRLPVVLPNQGPGTGTAKIDPFRRDLWSTPRGNRAASAYEDGALRRSMGI